MAGIVFTDIGQSLLPLVQMDQQDRQNALNMQWNRQRADEDRAFRQQDREDRQAFQRQEREDAAAARKQMFDLQMLMRMDEKTRNRLKDQADFSARSAHAILTTEPPKRNEVYKYLKAEGARLGFDMSNLPDEYTPDLDTRLDASRRMSHEILKGLESLPTPMPLPGAAPNPNNVGNVRPVGASTGFQQPASFDDGVALTVRNVGAYPKAFNNGQPMTLMQIGERWAPRGDGKNDPAQWARNVATYSNLPVDQPLDLTDPRVQAAFARGVHGAEWGGNAVRPLEAYLSGAARASSPRVIQAGGVPQGAPGAFPAGGPQIARGDNPGGMPSGAPDLSTPKGIRAWAAATLGARVMGVQGQPVYDKQGRLGVILSDGTQDWVDVPKPKDPPSGYEPAPGGGLQVMPGGPADVANRKNQTEQANKLRDDFRSEPVVKAYRVVVPMLESAKDAATRPTRAADINLVYAFAKLMDPDSVVRESETGMVTATGTVRDQLGSLLSQLNGGQMLQPETRKKLIAELESRFRSVEASYNEMENAYGEIADANNVPRKHVILPIRKPKMDGAASEDTPAPASPQGVTYMGPDNRPIGWKEIEATAKARNMSTDDVIKALNLKPAGGK